MKIKTEQYKVLANRRQAQDALIWQTPALSLAAQAFLLTIILNPYSSVIARCFAAGLSLLTALACLQLMTKHRYFEEQDSKLLENFEIDHEQEGYKIIHHRRTNSQKWYIRMSGYRFWQLTLCVFGAVALSAGLVAIAKPSLFATASNPEAQEIKRKVQDIANESSRLKTEIMSLQQQLNVLSRFKTTTGREQERLTKEGGNAAEVKPKNHRTSQCSESAADAASR